MVLHTSQYHKLGDHVGGQNELGQGPDRPQPSGTPDAVLESGLQTGQSPKGGIQGPALVPPAQKQKGKKPGKKEPTGKGKKGGQTKDLHQPRPEEQKAPLSQPPAPSMPTMPPGQLQEQLATIWNDLGYVNQQLEAEQARIYPYGEFDQQLAMHWRRLQGCSMTLQQIVNEMWRINAGAPLIPPPYLYAHPMYYTGPVMEPSRPPYAPPYIEKPPAGNYP